MSGFFNGCIMKIHVENVVDLKPSSRSKTREGFLVCKDARLAKPMIKDYYVAELGLPNHDPTDVVGIYTPPDVLFSQAVIDGFMGSDVVMQHPQGNKLNADNYKDHIIGTAKNVREHEGYLVADLVIKDKDATRAIEEDDVKQISLGYAAELDLTAGNVGDMAYHGRFVGMVADHIAVVPMGRCGADCAIGDEAKSMKVKIGNITFNVADEALAQAIEQQSKELEDLKAKRIKVGDTAFGVDELAAVQATADQMMAQNAELAAQNAELVANQVTAEQIEAMVHERAATISDAQKLNPSLVADGKTVADIKREVVQSRANDALVKAIVGDSQEQTVIDMAFKALVATDSKPNPSDAPLANLNNMADSKPDTTFDKSNMWRGA